MAFNVQDGKLYVLTNTVSALGSYSIATQGNKLYTVDYVNGEIEKVADITISHSNSGYRTLRTLAIDNDGTFYSVNTGSNTNVYLYKWTLDNIKNGVISNLKPATSTMRDCDLNDDGKTNDADAQIILDYVSGSIDLDDEKVEVADYDGDGKVTSYDAYLVLTAKDNSSSLGASGLYTTSFASMAYDHDAEILYLAGGYGTKSSKDVDNELWVINTETCKAAHPNTTYNAQFSDHTVGLYVVPANTVTIPTDVAVTSVELNKTELTVLKGSTLTLEAAVYPWLAADKSVTWYTSDASTVSVDNGTIKALKVGTATITATSVADSTKSAKCVVTVKKLDNIKVSGLVYGNDSKAYWSEFNTDKTEAWAKIKEGSNFVAGTFHEGEILVHDGSAMYGIDPDTFDATSYGEIASSWIWSDAAASPVSAWLVSATMVHSLK